MTDECNEGIELRYQSVSFQTDLWDRYRDVCKKIESGKKLCDRLIGVMKDVVQLEKNNASTYEKISSRWLTDTSIEDEGMTMCNLVDSLKKRLHNCATQSRVFTSAVKDDVLHQLESTAKNHSNVLKKLYSDSDKSHQYLQSASDNHDKALNKYFKLCTEAESASYLLEESDMQMNQPLRPQTVRAFQLRKDAYSAEDLYVTSVESYNEALKSNSKSMFDVLGVMQDIEKKRILCMKDAFRKLIVYEMAKLRNDQYDINDTVNAVESVDYRDDIYQFIIAHKTNYARPSPKEVVY
eukprot:GHVR01147343.1.p1 GENE.GHVR01147343.1~~GHVR01147343.1.p1  ORF type:complete len:303 (+),score=49.72 GHVR01147343.1:26-910(+)